MVKSGQFSLAYLFLMSFWAALTVCFARYTMFYATDFEHSEAQILGILSMFATALCGSIIVGGFFKSMRGGALAGSILIGLWLIGTFVCLWMSK